MFIELLGHICFALLLHLRSQSFLNWFFFVYSQAGMVVGRRATMMVVSYYIFRVFFFPKYFQYPNLTETLNKYFNCSDFEFKLQCVHCFISGWGDDSSSNKKPFANRSSNGELKFDFINFFFRRQFIRSFFFFELLLIF